MRPEHLNSRPPPTESALRILGRLSQDAAYVAYAPSASSVGLELPTGPDARDRSGVRVCATNRLRPNAAAVHWLGTEGILLLGQGRQQAVGQCRPNLQQPVDIISSSPHMHRRGVPMTTSIRRAGGGTDTLIDTPFDIDNQIIHDTPEVLRLGDSLTTTCTFDNAGGFATFGPRTDDEMCYNFVTAWPVGGLETGGSVIGQRHACMQ